MLISVPIIVRNAVKLNYPLDKVVKSVVGLADEVVISVDPTSEDDSVDYVYDLVLEVNSFLRRRVVKWFESPWNLNNINEKGTEFSIQTNKSIAQCSGDWIFLLQADEAVHENDFDLIKKSICSADKNGVDAFSMVRLYFYGDIDTIREDWTHPIVRLFRKGTRVSDGDAMNTSGSARLCDLPCCIYHYSRIGDPSIISRRILSLDRFFHPAEKLLPEGELKPYDFSTRKFDCMSKPGVDVGNENVDSVYKRFSGTHPKFFIGYRG